MIWHQISALAKVKGLNEIILLGVYEDSVLAQFLGESRREFPNVQIMSVPAAHLFKAQDQRDGASEEGRGRRGRCELGNEGSRRDEDR